VPIDKAAGTRLLLALGSVLLLVSLCWVMYGVVADYSYHAVAGVYRAKSDGVIATLRLGEDQSFVQEMVQNGRTQRSQGTWRRIGEGRVVFSKEFIRTKGEDVRSDGEVDGEVQKTLGLFFSIHMNPDPGGPVYYKRPFL
jgi:hypothetical protein